MDRGAQELLYLEAQGAHGAAMQRLARGYELDPERRGDLLQEMHIALWRSLASFDGRCSLRTWVYRVAHNVGASHVIRSRRARGRLVDIELIERQTASVNAEWEANRRVSMSKLLMLIQRLKPLDRQVMMLHLEGESAQSIAEVTGLSSENVATKVHRIKSLLKQQYLEGAAHGAS